MAALVLADSAAAQSTEASTPGSPQAFATPRHRSSGSIWTPARMRAAEPTDTSRLPSDEAAPRFVPQGLPPAGESRREPGAPPAANVVPDFGNRLFEAREPALELQADIAPQAASPYGSLYSNSRVFPRRALTSRQYRMVGKLFWHDPVAGDEGWCSASVIQLRLVATAGHCVYNAEGNYWHSDFRFVPAYDRGAAPFGAWDGEQAFTTASWINGGGDFPNPADFAILVMTDRFSGGGEGRAIGEVTGWLAWQADTVANSHVTILGYPGNLDAGERMQQTTAQTFEVDQAANKADFGSAHGAGASGGPFILNFGEMAAGQAEPAPNVLVGLYSYYYDTRTDELAGIVGTSIINGEFADLFDAACQATRGNCR